MTYEEAVQAVPCGLYRRLDGGIYEVTGIARNTETEEPMVVYRDRSGGKTLCTPADIWNGSAQQDGRTYRKFFSMDRIRRVEKYEKLFDEALLSHDPEKLRTLEAYYTSGEWQEDYEADERGGLPPDLKRGVLSQDALYDLLEGTKE